MMLGPILPLGMLGIPVVAAVCVVLVGLARLMFGRTQPVVVAAPAQQVARPPAIRRLQIPRGLPDLTLEALGRSRRLAAGTDAPETHDAREAKTVTRRPKAVMDAFELEPTSAWTGRQAR